MNKNEKIKELRRYQESLMYKDSGCSDSIYIPKMAFTSAGQETLMMFFESELSMEKDIYTECVSRDYAPEDEERTLYKFKHNPFFKEEYQKKETKTGVEAYLVPISELLNISKKQKSEDLEKAKNFKLLTPPKSNTEKMTIKDYCAIHWKLPVSDKEWLNNLIKETFNLK